MPNSFVCIFYFYYRIKQRSCVSATINNDGKELTGVVD